MAKFTVRVELRDASERDYKRLHKEMEDRGFDRELRSSDGKYYLLPSAEYYFDGEQDGAEVRSLAKSAATATGRSASVLVTESAGRWWSNLKEA